MNGTFDTLSYTKRLEAAGVPAEQAEAHALALREVMLAQCATKADIYDLREAILTQGGRLDAQAAESERRDLQLSAKIDLEVQRLDGSIKEQGSHLHNDMLKIKADLMGWTLALNISLVAILFAALTYFRSWPFAS
ncbi:hypothetical protein [Duganella sp. S19_KUP01_CR8]|uniref:hypothetical protein n=1 Tax=Duganella sp. S19_KUP01_CR8 TaxID=3025502 RepID=UPI002FCDDA72